jgi:TonB-dependent SusC/RagA subfamily outer membrane receptor
MDRNRFAPILALLSMAPLLAGPNALSAQRTIQGHVTDVATGEPIVGARVSVRGTGVLGTTGQAGLYTLEAVPARVVNLEVKAAGYVTVVEQVDVLDGKVRIVNFELGTLFGTVEELVVEARRRSERASGESVETVTATVSRPSVDAGEMVRASVPGATVLQPSGQVGSGFDILIRGLKSVAGGRDPIIYVDGVRLTRSQERDLMFGVRGPGSMDFLDPFTIERIEVIKGASASARYGPEASGGVILIFTKR